jgi:predicted XRE-type DNA-binding protein
MITIEESSGNVYEDMGYPEAESMQVRANLTSKIADIIHYRHLTQQQAAVILGITQSELSKLLCGQFRGVSEVNMLECLNRLGRDVEIVIRKSPRLHKQGQTTVVFAA